MVPNRASKSNTHDGPFEKSTEMLIPSKSLLLSILYRSYQAKYLYFDDSQRAKSMMSSQNSENEDGF